MDITIRDVPEEALDVLAARARRSGRTLEDYLRHALVDMTESAESVQMTGSVDQDELWDQIEARVGRMGVSFTADEILESIHDGRR